MRKIWAILLIILALSAAPGAGKYVGYAVLTALMPVYSLLLAGIFFLIFLGTSAVIVPIGQRWLERVESRAEPHVPAAPTREAA